MRKKVYGKGVTNTTTCDGHGKCVKSYKSWQNMLERCYSEKFHVRYPSYSGCFVCEGWLHYSNFKDWYDINYVEGFELDKDLLVDANKEYGPNTCRYVPSQLNSLFTKGGRKGNEYPIGVSYHKRHQKFIAHLRINGARQHLGYFTTPEEASNCYKTAKKKYCTKEVNKYLSEGVIGRDLYLALIRKIALL